MENIEEKDYYSEFLSKLLDGIDDEAFEIMDGDYDDPDMICHAEAITFLTSKIRKLLSIGDD